MATPPDFYGLGENPFDHSLSSRLPASSGNAIFNLANGAALSLHRDVGTLGALPFEIMHIILQQLDFSTLARLASVNKGMKNVIASLPKLCTLLNCAPDAMRAISASKVGGLITCADMYEKLCQPSCDECGASGTHFHLLACCRLCHGCLTVNLRYRALRPLQAAEQYALPRGLVFGLPALVVPKYSELGRSVRRKRREKQVNTTGWRLFDQQEIMRQSVLIHGSVGAVEKAASKRFSDLFEKFRLKLSRNRRAGMTYRHHRVVVHDYAAFPRHPIKHHTPPGVESAYSVSTLLPWFDLSTKDFGHPVLCNACQRSGMPLRQCYYFASAAEQHIERFGKITDGFHVKTT
ncbi:hypothetical protein PWT90_02642 [Aphanocladium album]|nr:hypothetical protein PWT90_02642 [Aphanocladium album]